MPERPDFSRRSYQKELLDGDDIPFPDIARNMHELDFINTWLGGHAISVEGLRQLSGGRRQLSICEIGCGGPPHRCFTNISSPRALRHNWRLPSSTSVVPVSSLRLGVRIFGFLALCVLAGGAAAIATEIRASSYT